jgi:hypothetical protein
LLVEAINEGGVYGETHRWSNVPQTINAGEKVTFSNPGEVPHGVEWRSAVKPACEEGAGKVPVGTTFSASGTKWSGKCTFSQAGSYLFYCTVHGAAMSGTITVNNPGEAVASTEPATAVNETEATLNGTVNPSGHETTYFFRRGRTTSYEEASTPVQTLVAGSTAVQVSAPLAGLTPGTTYHYRLVAKNEKGTVEGADKTFTTATPPGPPTVAVSQASSIGETSSTLNGLVNPDGQTTAYLFNYGTSTSYGQHSAELTLPASDHTSHTVSVTLSGLSPGAHYHFQLVAENKSARIESADQQFQAAATPVETPPSTITTTTATTPAVTTPLITPPAKEPVLGAPVKLSAGRRGSSVHGILEVTSAGAGGRLEVSVLAVTAHGRHAKPVSVGRLVRDSVSAGEDSFSVALNARGRSALRHRHRLSVTVKITLTPVLGKALTLTRLILVRA